MLFLHLCKRNLYLALLLVSSCKPSNNDNSLSTVDNFTNDKPTEFTLNHCGGKPSPLSPAVAALLADQSRFSFEGNVFANVREDILEVLQNVPESVLKIFTANKKAKIYLSPGESPICRSIANNAGSEVGIKQSFSCWVANDKEDGIAFGTGIRLGADGKDVSVSLSEAIRHSLLRSLLYYVYVQMKVQLPNQAHLDEFGALMIQGLRNDLQKRNLPDISEQDAGDKNYIQNLMLEVWDSQHCSVETQEILKNCFPNLAVAAYSNKPLATVSDVSMCKAGK